MYTTNKCIDLHTYMQFSLGSDWKTRPKGVFATVCCQSIDFANVFHTLIAVLQFSTKCLVCANIFLSDFSIPRCFTTQRINYNRLRRIFYELCTLIIIQFNIKKCIINKYSLKIDVTQYYIGIFEACELFTYYNVLCTVM